MSVNKYQGIKLEQGNSFQIVDDLTVEEALQISVNNKPFTVTMRSPGDDDQLVRGLLHTEGIIKRINFHPKLTYRDDNGDGIIQNVEVNIPLDELGDGYSNSRSLLSVSSCGICGRTELNEKDFCGEQLTKSVAVSIDSIFEMFQVMQENQVSFKQSGGTHAAVSFNKSGLKLSAKEDIGRHNAVDKVIGDMIISKQLKEAYCITVSGRISYEIIIKCFKAKIPVIAAISAPSSLAIDFAKELGITVLGFCRDHRATCYSHPERIQNNKPS